MRCSQHQGPGGEGVLGIAQARHLQQPRVRGQRQLFIDLRNGRDGAEGQQFRAGNQSALFQILGEGVDKQRGILQMHLAGYVGAYALDARKQPLLHQAGHGHADGGTADAILLAQIHLARDQIARDPVAAADLIAHGGQHRFIKRDRHEITSSPD